MHQLPLPTGCPRLAPLAFVACLAAATASPAAAQTAGPQIYSCIDASGRRLTADRPILDCIDREQRVLSPSGALKRTVPPSYTAAERAAHEEKVRLESTERNRQAEERQRSRALLVRFPSQDVLDRERAAALATVEDVIATAKDRIAELRAERARLDAEAAPHDKASARMPVSLAHAIEANEKQRQAQERFIADQREESLRVTQRFDDMQRQLNTLWAQQAAGSAGR